MPRTDGESLARELTLGALSYSDLARRAHMVAERFFPRRLRFVELVVVEPDQPDLLPLFRVMEGGVEVVRDQRPADGRDPAAHAARMAEPLLLGPDLASESRERDIVLPENPPPSLLLIPLVRDGRKSGALVLGLESIPGTEITRRWADLTGAMHILAAALQSCREHERTVAEREELERIAQAGTRLHVLSSFEETCRVAIRIPVEELGFDRAVLFLISEDGTALECRATVGYEEIGAFLRVALEPARDAVAEAFHSGVPCVIRRGRDDSRIPVLLRESGEIQGAVALLLGVGGERIGVLWADHRRARSHPSLPSRLPLLGLYASQAAAALANSRLVRRIEALSDTDPLTGLANRRHLEGVLRREVPRLRRNGGSLSLLLIDVVALKGINRQFGRDAGDQVLREIAQLLRSTLRETDVVARFGGDEFVILMPDTQAGTAERCRERIAALLDRRNAARPENTPRIELEFGIRAGDAVTAPGLLAEADRRLFEEREDGLRVQLLDGLLARRREESLRSGATLFAALEFLERKDHQFIDHSRRVMQLALALAGTLGLSERERVCLGLAALLHDLGKLFVPAEWLTRPGPLTPEELEIVREHSARGEEALCGVTFLAPVRSLVRAHHERFDGRTDVEFPAYPDGLTGRDIPVGARILKIVDAYDAITTGRPYRAARSSAVALDIIHAEKGGSFDPELVDLFVNYLLVRLHAPATPLPVQRGEAENS